MPIYEYYCSGCHGRFRHLARKMDAPAPACPRCGSEQVERLISAANYVRGASDHRQDLKQEAAQVDRDDPQAMAQFLNDSGRLSDAEGLYGSRAYKELIARRMAGASDADVTDLVDDLTAAAGQSDAASDEVRQMASALALSERVENRMQAEGPPDHHDHGSTTESGVSSRPDRTRRSARDLGWG